MNRNILNLRQLTVLLILCTAFLGGIIPAFAQQGGKKITGQVIDENKEPMIGVSILIVGTSTGTVTDFDGNYTLNVPQGNKELQFSYVGYETKIVALPTSGSVLNVQMKSDSQVLSDVVVIGYGTQRKSDLTGSVTNVSSKDFNMGLVSSPEQLINGKISGVQIMSNSGSPTAGSTIRVRGGASLNASNDPLIVLDGVPLEQGGISGNDGNFLSLINPNDIESMTILKDASSTAIYVRFACIQRGNPYHYQERDFGQTANHIQHYQLHSDTHQTGGYVKLRPICQHDSDTRNFCPASSVGNSPHELER